MEWNAHPPHPSNNNDERRVFRAVCTYLDTYISVLETFSMASSLIPKIFRLLWLMKNFLECRS